MIKRLPDTLLDATCADSATPTACTGRDGDHAERWQAGVCAYIAEGSGDGQVCTGPVEAARERWRQRGGRLASHTAEVPAPDREAEVERLQAEVDRLSGRTAASELARLSREARDVRQALDMPDGAHAAVVAAIAGMRREGADLLAREAALRMAAARQTGWECPTTYEGVRAQVRLMDGLREQGKAAVADLRRWHDLLRADLGAVLRALGVPDAIEHVAAEAASEGLPRVVEWADLQPGDLALDADSSVGLWRQDGKRSGSWRANNGTRVSGTRDGVDTSPDHVMSRRAILLARGVPKRASAIRAAWEAVRPQAERLAAEARKEGA